MALRVFGLNLLKNNLNLTQQLQRFNNAVITKAVSSVFVKKLTSFTQKFFKELRQF